MESFIRKLMNDHQTDATNVLLVQDNASSPVQRTRWRRMKKEDIDSKLFPPERRNSSEYKSDKDGGEGLKKKIHRTRSEATFLTQSKPKRRYSWSQNGLNQTPKERDWQESSSDSHPKVPIRRTSGVVTEEVKWAERNQTKEKCKDTQLSVPTKRTTKEDSSEWYKLRRANTLEQINVALSIVQSPAA